MAGATHVFYGEVVESSPLLDSLPPGTISRSARRNVRFQVLNALKGVDTPVVTETFIYENVDPNEFRPGRRYLVYASRIAGQLSIECTRTRMMMESSAATIVQEIAQLEACVKNAGP
jgi:hypothetical protein